ncbi:MAG: ATP-binding protein [Acidobacteriota bacterium]
MTGAKESMAKSSKRHKLKKSKGTVSMSLKVPSDLKYTDFFESVFRVYAEELEVPQERQEWLCLSLREAVNNALLHGNHLDPEKYVEVTVEKSGSDLVIRVLDQGTGFDRSNLLNPTEPENILRPHGRGIYLIRQFVDDLRFLDEQSGRFGLEMWVDLDANPAT